MLAAVVSHGSRRGSWNTALTVGWGPFRRLAVHFDGAGAGLIQAGDQAQQRGLAAAGAAEDGDDLALGDADIDVAQGFGAIGVGFADGSDGELGHSRSLLVSCQRSTGRLSATSTLSEALPSSAKMIIATRIESARPICSPSSSR